MIMDLGLPSFDIVLRNARIGFSSRLLFRQSFELADAYVLLLGYLVCMSCKMLLVVGFRTEPILY